MITYHHLLSRSISFTNYVQYFQNTLTRTRYSGVSDKRDQSCRNWTCKTIMTICIAILSIAVVVLGIVLGNGMNCSGTSIPAVLTTTATKTIACEPTPSVSTITVVETLTNTCAAFSKATTTSYITSAYTSYVTEVSKKTITAPCTSTIDSLRTTIISELPREKTSVASAERSSESLDLSTVLFTAITSTTLTALQSASASPSPSPTADPGAVLTSETLHVPYIYCCTVY